MSVVAFKATSIPVFHPKVTPTTISKLLEILAHPRSTHVTVYLLNGEAWISLRNTQLGDRYFLLSDEEWNMVRHVLYDDPLSCSCRICYWRCLRVKYLPEVFKHLF